MSTKFVVTNLRYRRFQLIMAGLGQPAREDDSKEILVEVDFDGNGFLYFGNGSITRKSYSIDLYFSRSLEDPFSLCKCSSVKSE